MTPTAEAARGAFTGWQKGAGVTIGVGEEGSGGAGVFLQDPSMVGNITRQK